MAQGYYGTEDRPLDGLHSERVVLTPHDSGEPDQYGMRLRTDLDSGDRIATVLVNNGTVGEAPVYPDGTSTPSGIAEGPPVYVPGEGWGFIPIREEGGAFEEYVIWHGGARHGLHDSLTVIPDSAIDRYNSTEVSESDGQTVDPWPDLIGSMDLVAEGSPSLSAGSLNGNDAIDINGVDDGYEYDQNLSGTVDEPVTILWAFSLESLPSDDIVTLWVDGVDATRNGIIIRTDVDPDVYRLNIQETTDGGGSPATGDHIVTMAVDDSSAILRVNGTQVASVSTAAGISILDGSTGGSFFYDKPDNRRHMHALAGEPIIHDERLSGSDLTGEEERLESAFNMSVL